MPDQSSAATEHAILQEITAPLENLPDDPVAMVHADFPGALRGYDRPAVDAYVQRISLLVAELQATRSPEAAVRRALERVGEQISGILQRAHETAEQITTQSRGEAEDRLNQARGEAAEIIEAAQQRVRDLDADADRIWIERGRIIDDARDLARQLLSVAETAADAFPESESESEPESVFEPESGSDAEPEAVRSQPYDDREPGGVRTEDEDEDELERQDELESRHDLTTHVSLHDVAREASGEVAPAGHEEPEPGVDDPEEALEDPKDTRRYDDIGATVRYNPLQPEPTEAPADAEDPGDTSEPEVRGTRAAIPPASEAAHRRPETR